MGATEGSGALIAGGQGEAAANTPAVPEEKRIAPRFAVAGQVIGGRKTVFAAIPIAVIRPNPHQPRQHFDGESLKELAESIRARGLLQPVIVRRDSDGGYTLVAGERRLRAAELAGIGLVPAILSNHDLLEVALEENIQREDLSPLEEAQALAVLAAERGHSHADLATVIHKSRPYVSNTLALMRLPPDVKREYLEQGAAVPREIMISIARQQTPEEMRTLWRRVKLGSLSVRCFRARNDPKPSAEPIAGVLRATRRLGRAIRAMGDASALASAQADPLRRALLRAQRAIDRVMQDLPDRTSSHEEPPAT